MKKRERLCHQNRCMPARVFRISPDQEKPFVVEVRIARNRRHMREEMIRLDSHREGSETQGLVRSWHKTIGSREPVSRPRLVVARIYLNTKDLRSRPSEIVAHEATHAGMAWARYKRARLSAMPGEEVLCYAVGRMVRQINHHLYAFGVF